jgi:hypothetical protein
VREYTKKKRVGNSGHSYRKSTCGRIEKNEGGFLIRQHTLTETSVDGGGGGNSSLISFQLSNFLELCMVSLSTPNFWFV